MRSLALGLIARRVPLNRCRPGRAGVSGRAAAGPAATGPAAAGAVFTGADLKPGLGAQRRACSPASFSEGSLRPESFPSQDFSSRPLFGFPAEAPARTFTVRPGAGVRRPGVEERLPAARGRFTSFSGPRGTPTLGPQPEGGSDFLFCTRGWCLFHRAKPGRGAGLDPGSPGASRARVQPAS